MRNVKNYMMTSYTINRGIQSYYGLTPVEYIVAEFIAYRQRLKVNNYTCSDTQKEIAEELEITRQSVSKAITRLHELELLEYGPTTHTRRMSDHWIAINKSLDAWLDFYHDVNSLNIDSDEDVNSVNEPMLSDLTPDVNSVNKNGQGLLYIEEKEEEREEEIVFPFDSDKFLKYWGIWISYKKDQFNFKYKSKVAEQSALKKLARLSGGNEDQAIAIIEQSLENGWKGFFQLKNSNENGITGEQAREVASELGIDYDEL